MPETYHCVKLHSEITPDMAVKCTRYKPIIEASNVRSCHYCRFSLMTGEANGIRPPVKVKPLERWN